MQLELENLPSGDLRECVKCIGAAPKRNSPATQSSAQMVETGGALASQCHVGRFILRNGRQRPWKRLWSVHCTRMRGGLLGRGEPGLLRACGRHPRGRTSSQTSHEMVSLPPNTPLFGTHPNVVVQKHHNTRGRETLIPALYSACPGAGMARQISC